MGHRTTVFRNSLIVSVLLLLASGSAFAQATRTWVSGVGDDVNPCSRTAPCKTWAGAISKTADGGIINCLDPGGFGTVTITKNMTISCKHVEGSGLASSTTGILVNGAGIKVVLRGLDIDGGTAALPGVNGIRFLQGASLIVEDCVIRDFTAAAPNGNGIIVNNTSTTVKLNVINSDITGNGTGADTAGAGILIIPSGTGGAKVTITNTRLSANLNGFRADATATTGGIDAIITDSSASNSTFHGIEGKATTGFVSVMLNRVTVANNGANGLRASGAATVFRTGSSVITANVNGVTIAGGAVMQSYGNNQNNGNNVNGAFTPVGLQ
jgi:hypothetical protein